MKNRKMSSFIIFLAILVLVIGIVIKVSFPEKENAHTLAGEIVKVNDIEIIIK